MTEESQLFAEPTIALRVWRVSVSYGQFRLESPSHHAKTHGIWEPFREFQSHCEKCKTPESLYTCECGIYAWNTDCAEGWQSIVAASSSPYYVAGEVSLWGHVQVNEKAYRASTAYPKCLYAFNEHHTLEQVEKIQSIAQTYGISVKHMDIDIQKLLGETVLSVSDEMPRGLISKLFRRRNG